MNLITNVDRDGKTLDVWLSGGTNKRLRPPCPPHFWSLVPRDDAVRLDVPLMSDIHRPVPLYRVDCETVYDVNKLRDADSIEADIPFIQLLTLLYGFEQKDTEAKVGAWDIESISRTGQFPNAKRDPITQLAYFSGTHRMVFDGDEAGIIEGFCDIVKSDNPDILATYNGARFDWQYLSRRAVEMGIPLPLGRRGDPPWIKEVRREYGKIRGVDYLVRLHGRICFDAWKETRLDTALTGRVPNRQLKSVAAWFREHGVIPADCPIISVNYAKMGEMDPKDLAEYCLSDSRLTWYLAEHYLRMLKDLAVYLKAPLNLMVDRSPSHVGNFIYGQEFKRLGVVSDKTNYERFEGVLW
jgi:DNA polymerase elongation subunit (family B)